MKHPNNEARHAPRWLDRPGVRSVLWQSLLGALIACAIWWFARNVIANMPRLQMELHWGFLQESASFEIGDNPIGYRAGDSYLKAFGAGLANTLQVSLIGMVLTAVFGTLVALCRLSTNWLVRQLAWLYVEIARNLPLLLQLFLWHAILMRHLPSPSAAWQPMPGVVVSNRGITLAQLEWQGSFGWALLALAASMLVTAWVRRRAGQSRLGSAAARRTAWLCLAAPLAVLLGLSGPVVVEQPVLRGLNLVGGVTLVPEFFALLFGLVFCHAGFAAESIRSGILSVDRGQWDAARSLGLRWWPTMRKVVMPQALQVFVPPLTSNFLSLTKSSSLAVAIGYPDLMRVSTVAISDTGRAVECVITMLLVYLTLSLLTSMFMNAYNRRVALQRGLGA